MWIEFYTKLQREMDEYDRDLEKKYGDHMDTTYIFVVVCSRVWEFLKPGADRGVSHTRVYSPQ